MTRALVASYRRFDSRLPLLFRRKALSGGKIFGIGFNKTGTSTLGRCFDTLGYSPNFSPKAAPTTFYMSPRPLNRAIYDHGNYGPALQVANSYRAFQDRPWNIWDMYKVLDAAFSDSKFILTYRDPEKWWASVDRWLNIRHKNDHARLDRYLKHLKVDSLDKDKCIASYLQYNEDVKKYFNGKTNLLLVNFEDGDSWEKLCDFLNKPIPDVPFPHINKQTYNR